ncbi:MAG TPA: M23 family metallopeptidase [Candidatus Obscuribacter sp.]|nr:M23 family metallopeptidase [Candidatus Obscuribacter sp.]
MSNNQLRSEHRRFQSFLRNPLLKLQIIGSLLVTASIAQGAYWGCLHAQEETVSSSAPAPQEVWFSSEKPKQGETVEVELRMPAAVPPPPVEFNKESYKFFPFQAEGGTIYKALFTVPVVMKPGPRSVKIGSTTRNITVVDAHYPVQRMTLPPSKNNFNTAPGEEEAIDGAKGTVSAERFWKGNFQAPSAARVSAGFGLRRIVNGKLLDDYFHSGLDFAGGIGSPVAACAPGKVLLAVSKGFKLHGNTVAIDHGQGVVSFYIHLSKVLVKEGQMVKQGEKIGAIGQTGRANGPHLHFSIYVNKVASTPWQWFRKAH